MSDGDDRPPFLRDPELRRDDGRMTEPGVASRVGLERLEPEVVHHDHAARRDVAEDTVGVVLRVAAVDEEKVERRLGRKHVSPVAGDDAYVRVLREQPGGGGGAFRVDLHRHDWDRRIEGGDDPGGADTDTGPDLPGASDAPSCGEDMEQQSVLVETRALEAEPGRESLRTLDERGSYQREISASAVVKRTPRLRHTAVHDATRSSESPRAASSTKATFRPRSRNPTIAA